MTPKVLLGFGAFAAALMLFLAAVLVIDATRNDVIGDGVRIGPVDVGGLDREEARERVRPSSTGT